MADRELAYRIVDAFTSRKFAGNPAAVVLNAADLDDELMLRIAAEFNLSETVFILPPESGSEADLKLRWFTPQMEVGMCGHATLAAVYALIEVGLLPARNSAEPGSIRIATRSGVLHVLVDEQQVVWLDLVDPVLRPAHPLPEDILSALRVDHSLVVDSPGAALTQDGDLLLFIRDTTSLNDLRPDFAKLAEVCARSRIRGVCVASTVTLDPAIHVQSRFFAPAAGVNEDPVTGSVHGPLAAHLMATGHVPALGDLAALRCVQGRPGDRAGLVQVFVQRQKQDQYAVRIGGPCVTTAAGVLYC